ncbi:MAG: glutathione-disulfide reductase [Pseudohongiellaceae bacterium]
MTEHDYDLFVIGAGSGGVRAARTAAGLGARVAIAEERYLGGTCVNVGCVPKKLYSYAAHFRHDFEDSAGYGWEAQPLPPFDLQALVANKNREISRLNGIYASLLEDHGVTVYRERARLAGDSRVNVGRDTVTARHILIATGGWPFVPDIPGREHAVTSNEFFFLDRVPDSIVIAGGGYIGVELGGILALLGCRVTLIQRRNYLLPGFDADLRDEIEKAMSRYATVILEDQIERIDRLDSAILKMSLRSGGALEAEQVLFATGRRPNTADLGLDVAGVATAESGAVIVDDHFMSSVPGIHAVGDVIDRTALTPVALSEGQALARQLFGPGDQGPDYSLVPAAVFSQPPLATVGQTEEQARERYDNVTVYRTRFTHMRHSLSGRDEKVFMKLVVDSESDRVLGVHMQGPDAPEIMQGFAVALQAGATKAQFDATIGIHPTAAEEFVTMRTPD